MSSWMMYLPVQPAVERKEMPRSLPLPVCKRQGHKVMLTGLIDKAKRGDVKSMEMYYL